MARLVIPGLPHHVTQRGNRSGQRFFEESDYALYLDLLAEASARARTEVWAYCLMPNHIYVTLVPADEDGLCSTFADLHRRCAAFIKDYSNGRLQLSMLPNRLPIGVCGE